MSSQRSKQESGFARIIRKSLVSIFVLSSYVAYVVHERFVAPAADPATLAPTPNTSLAQPDTVSQNGGQAAPQTAPTESLASPAPTATAPVASPNQGQYKNGTYTGPVVNAFYGFVQVRVSVQNGKIANVQFVQYPNDRRTSVRINSIAMPYLQSEAIQAQSANVDIISGATLTSEAFVESLQSALANARS